MSNWLLNSIIALTFDIFVFRSFSLINYSIEFAWIIIKCVNSWRIIKDENTNIYYGNFSWSFNFVILPHSWQLLLEKLRSKLKDVSICEFSRGKVHGRVQGSPPNASVWFYFEGTKFLLPVNLQNCFEIDQRSWSKSWNNNLRSVKAILLLFLFLFVSSVSCLVSLNSKS